MLKALIFDFDGLILDTEVPIYEAWREDYRAHGHDLPLDLYAQCVGSNFGRFDPKQHLEFLTGKKLAWDELDEAREKEAIARVQQLEPFPGVVELLQEAAASEVPCVVASSSPRHWVEGHLDRLELASYFQGTRCLDDVEHPKPNPELFLAAAALAEVDPAEALVLEDSYNGLEAAKAAGIPCVIVPNQITSHYEFEGALRIVEGMASIRLNDLAEFHQTS
ncbi:MAG: HAD-IA family hydrolase [Verrucomicrobiota bacterium]